MQTIRTCRRPNFAPAILIPILLALLFLPQTVVAQQSDVLRLETCIGLLPEPAALLPRADQLAGYDIRYAVVPQVSAAGVSQGTLLLVSPSGVQTKLPIALTVVEDTVAPTISGVRNYTIYRGEPLDYLSSVRVTDNFDPAPAISIEDPGVDLNTPGEYIVTFTAADFSGNIVSASSKITILDDTTPPVISGVRKWGVYLGDTADYLSGVTVSDERDPNPTLTVDASSLDFTTPGRYEITFTATDSFGNVSTATSLIVIKADVAPPEFIGVRDLELFLGDTYDFTTGVTASDNRDGEVPFSVDTSSVDLSKTGTYTVTYTAADRAGNTATLRAKVRVRRDTTAPVIHGAKEITVEVGHTVSYRKGVTVTDDRDAAPQLTIDNSKVNLSAIGRYKLTYSAADSSGNTSSVSVWVNVVRELMTEDDLDLLWPLVDEILAEITTEDMTPMEKGFKIYGWTKRNIRYNGKSDKSHWVMGAYDGLTTRRGDCFTYFAVSKALLERAGIPNVDVVKSDTRYSQHFWSLVDVGSGWYHFDSCQLTGERANFYLVTDAELARWDKKNRNAHPFDSTLYPERATESVQSRLNYYQFTVKD
ncbi:MAG: DUF5011 domain-containing protein [Clostridia bacterium]|nr:DUF5011 domain-containing protein [Clostridia bacterium]